MKRQSINQIVLTIHEKLNTLLNTPDPQTKPIFQEIKEISENNQSYTDNIANIILDRYFKETRNNNRLNLLYLIDFLIKSLGAQFSIFFNHIFRMFEEAYNVADEETKILLFKLYYAWKHFMEPNILDNIRRRFRLDEMKEKLLREKPDLIQRYDRYNDDIEVQRYNRIQQIQQQNQIINPVATIPVAVSNNTLSTTINSSNTSNFVKVDNLEKSLLSNLAIDNNVPKKKEKKDMSDLFSSSGGSSPDVSPAFSNQGENNTNLGEIMDDIDKTAIKKLNTKKNSQINKDFNNNNNNNLNNFKNKKAEYKQKKKEQQLRKQPAVNIKKNNDFNQKPNLMNKQANINISNINNPNFSYNKGLINSNAMYNQIPTNSNTNITPLPYDSKRLSSNVNQHLMSYNNQIIPNQLLINSSNSANINNNIFLNNNINNSIYHLLNSNMQMQLLNSLKSNNLAQNSIQYPKADIQMMTGRVPLQNPINLILNRLSVSTIKLNENNLFFSSISKWVYDSLQENKITKYLDNPNEILSKRFDDNKEKKLYLHNEILFTLYNELKNVCSNCSFRTKHYNIYIDHLDTHYYINILKRNSDKKILYRRENFLKEKWINTKQSTLESIIFYQNENDLNLNSRNMVSKNLEFNDENYKLIFPFISNEINCAYCKEEFKKKYLNKYKFWFYVNIKQISPEDNKNNILSNKDRIKFEGTEYFLLHSNCYDEFKELSLDSHTLYNDEINLKNLASNFVQRKRNYEESFNLNDLKDIFNTTKRAKFDIKVKIEFKNEECDLNEDKF